MNFYPYLYGGLLIPKSGDGYATVSPKADDVVSADYVSQNVATLRYVGAIHSFTAKFNTRGGMGSNYNLVDTAKGYLV